MEKVIGFVIWALVGIFFIAMGIYDWNAKSKRPFGFWANAETFPVEDVASYNRAVGKLWCVFGIIFIILGLPMLAEQDSPIMLISMLGVAFESIGAMVVYVTKIEKKYRK